MTRYRMLLAALAVVAIPSIASIAAGLFPGLPIVGGASYCGGSSTGASGSQVCTVTVPAGPSTLTGSELIPADTQLSQGQAPQTVSVPSAMIRTMGTECALTDGATITLNLQTACEQYTVTLGGNRSFTMSNLTGMGGAARSVIFKQDSAGARTVTLSGFNGVSSDQFVTLLGGTPTFSNSTPTAESIWTFRYSATDNHIYVTTQGDFK